MRAKLINEEFKILKGPSKEELLNKIKGRKLEDFKLKLKPFKHHHWWNPYGVLWKEFEECDAIWFESDEIVVKNINRDFVPGWDPNSFTKNYDEQTNWEVEAVIKKYDDDRIYDGGKFWAESKIINFEGDKALYLADNDSTNFTDPEALTNYNSIIITDDGNVYNGDWLIVKKYLDS